MADDALDQVEVLVGRGLRLRQHVGGVEDVERLVLHRAHVEVVDGDDIEDVEVVLAAVDLLVPLHRVLEGLHGVAQAVGVLVLAPDLEVHLAAAHGGEAVLDAAEVAGDQREQVARLLERVLPDGVVAAVGGAALFDQVAVREQHRATAAVSLDPDPVASHDVRAVREVGDAAEALGFTLGAEHVRAAVEAAELGVLLRLDPHLGAQLETLGQAAEAQLLVLQPVGAGAEGAAVEPDAQQLEVLAVQGQLGRGGCTRGPLDLHPGRHPGVVRVELEVELQAEDLVVRFPVVLSELLDRLRLHRGVLRHPGILAPPPLGSRSVKICRPGARSSTG